ncbi:MAG: hypothetical protein RDV48_01785 [Candidatus Eremiobacteraeota bacterium]|nr:hypothetical protein [Candidatus Eremiobacteraeota bacterium]
MLNFSDMGKKKPEAREDLHKGAEDPDEPIDFLAVDLTSFKEQSQSELEKKLLELRAHFHHLTGKLQRFLSTRT